jgi:hypothetical protein
MILTMIQTYKSRVASKHTRLFFHLGVHLILNSTVFLVILNVQFCEGASTSRYVAGASGSLRRCQLSGVKMNRSSILHPDIHRLFIKLWPQLC